MLDKLLLIFLSLDLISFKMIFLESHLSFLRVLASLEIVLADFKRGCRHMFGSFEYEQRAVICKTRYWQLTRLNEESLEKTNERSRWIVGRGFCNAIILTFDRLGKKPAGNKPVQSASFTTPILQLSDPLPIDHPYFFLSYFSNYKIYEYNMSVKINLNTNILVEVSIQVITTKTFWFSSNLLIYKSFSWLSQTIYMFYSTVRIFIIYFSNF